MDTAGLRRRRRAPGGRHHPGSAVGGDRHQGPLAAITGAAHSADPWPATRPTGGRLRLGRDRMIFPLDSRTRPACSTSGMWATRSVGMHSSQVSSSRSRAGNPASNATCGVPWYQTCSIWTSRWGDKLVTLMHTTGMPVARSTTGTPPTCWWTSTRTRRQPWVSARSWSQAWRDSSSAGAASGPRDPPRGPTAARAADARPRTRTKRSRPPGPRRTPPPTSPAGGIPDPGRTPWSLPPVFG
jgi:hypothetical protein